MATLSQIFPARRTPAPLVLWHLLSLDAPCVAVLWTWFVARVSGISLPAGSLLALFLAVWILYAADRLLDTRALSRPMPLEHRGTLEARHLFHHRHARLFLSCMAAAALLLLWLVPRMDPATLRLYGFEGAVLALWFLILHATRSAHRLPKEWAVGLFFAAAIFIPTVARAPQLQPRLLPGAILFAVLCGLNCLYIYRWEHESGALSTPPRGRVPATEPSLAARLSGFPIRDKPSVTGGYTADPLGDRPQPPHATTRLGLSLLHPFTLLAHPSGCPIRDKPLVTGGCADDPLRDRPQPPHATTRLGLQLHPSTLLAHPSGCPIRDEPLVTGGHAADPLDDRPQPPHATTRLGLSLLHPSTLLAHPSGCPIRDKPLVTGGCADDPLGDRPQPPHATTRLGLQLLQPVTALAFASGLVLALLDPAALRPLGLTCAASVAALWLLDREHTRLQPVTLRAAADLVLMLPLLFLPFLRSA